MLSWSSWWGYAVPVNLAILPEDHSTYIAKRVLLHTFSLAATLSIPR
jgi:hypothetical protein